MSSSLLHPWLACVVALALPIFLLAYVKLHRSSGRSPPLVVSVPQAGMSLVCGLPFVGPLLGLLFNARGVFKACRDQNVEAGIARIWCFGFTNIVVVHGEAFLDRFFRSPESELSFGAVIALAIRPLLGSLKKDREEQFAAAIAKQMKDSAEHAAKKKRDGAEGSEEAEPEESSYTREADDELNTRWIRDSITKSD
jgi:hypothetical protein